MRIEFKCIACDSPIAVSQKHSGKKVRCKKCGNIQRVLQVAATASPVPSAGAPGAPAVYEYDAFISYRHADLDRKWASWLVKTLETYRTPRRLVKDQHVRRRLSRIFRDEDELPASPNLKDEIRRALLTSRFLIVICSKSTPESQWINQEIQQFRDLQRDERILALLVDGEPSESFPVALREIRRKAMDASGNENIRIEEVEPLAADVRARESASNGHLRTMAKLRLLARLLGVKFDHLRQRDAARRRRTLRGLSAVAVLLLAVLGGLIFMNWRSQEQIHKEQLARQQLLETSNARDKERVAKIEEQNRNAQTQQALVGSMKVQVDRKEQQVETEQKLRRWPQYVTAIEQIKPAWEINDTAKIRELLANQIPDPKSGLEDLRGIEWYFWNRQTHYGLRFETGQDGVARALAFSPDGKFIAMTDRQHIHVWNLQTGKEQWNAPILPPAPPTGPIPLQSWDQSVIFNSDGKWVAATAESGADSNHRGAFKVWQTDSGAELLSVQANDRIGGHAIAFGPDGTDVVLGGFSNLWTSWDVPTKRPSGAAGNDVPRGRGRAPAPRPSGPGQDSRVKSLVFTVGGRPELVTGFDRGNPAFWTWPEGQPAPNAAPFAGGGFGGGGGGGGGMRPGPVSNGFTLAGQTPLFLNVGEQGLEVLQASNLPRIVIDTGTYVNCIAGQNGAVVAGCGDGLVEQWSLTGYLPKPPPAPRIYRGANAAIQCVAMTGGIVAAVAKGELLVWKNVPVADVLDLPQADEQSLMAGLGGSPDGKYQAAWNAQHTVYSITETDTGRVVSSTPASDRPVAVHISPHSRYAAIVLSNLLTGSRQANPPGTLPAIRIVDLQNAKLIRTVPNAFLPSRTQFYSEDDALIGLEIRKQGVKVFRCSTGQEVFSADLPAVADVCLSRTGRYVALASEKLFEVYGIQDSRMVLSDPENVSDILFDVSERRVLAHTGSGTLLGNLEDGSLSPAKFIGGISSDARILFSKDQRRAYELRSGGSRSTLNIYSADGDAELAQVQCKGTPDILQLEDGLNAIVQKWKSEKP